MKSLSDTRIIAQEAAAACVVVVDAIYGGENNDKIFFHVNGKR